MSSDVTWDDGVRQQYPAATSVIDKPARMSPQPSAAIVAPDLMASSSFPAFSTNENVFMPDVDAFRSRSPSISPRNGGDQFPSHLFNGDDRLSAPQQSMYINGRGFYSDPYLSLASNNSCGGDVLSSAVFLPPTTDVTSFDFAHQHLQQQDEVSAPTYAVSNPDSDTSSTSFESSGDEQHSLFGGGSAPTLLQPSSSLQGSRHHSLSVSPVSF